MAEKQIYTFPDGTTLIYYQQNINKCTDVNVGFRIPLVDIPKQGEMVGLYKNVVFYLNAVDQSAPIRIPLIKPGIAHLAEHMFFSSLPEMDKEEIYKVLMKTNTEYNAETSQDYVKTMFNCPSKFVDEIFALESKMIFRDSYNADDLKAEKEPVYQELERSNDSKIHQIFDFMHDNYETLTSQEILGIDKKVIDSITEKQLVKFGKTYFTRQNMIISVVSDLPFEKIKKLCEENFVNKAPSIVETKITTPPRVYNFYNDLMLAGQDKSAKTVSIYFMLKGTKDTERNALFTNIEDFILNNFNGRLFKAFRTDTGYCYTPMFNTFDFPQQPIKLFTIQTTPPNMKQCINLLASILDDLLTNGITDEEFDGFKEMWENRRERKTAIKYNSASVLFYKHMYGEPVFIGNFFEKTKKITKADINKYLWDIYANSKLCVAITGNYDSKSLIPLQTILSKYRPYDKYLNKNFIDHKEQNELYKYINYVSKHPDETSDIEFLNYNVPPEMIDAPETTNNKNKKAKQLVDEQNKSL